MVHGEVSYLPYLIELGTFPLSITFSCLLFCLTSKCIASFPLMLTEKALKKKKIRDCISIYSYSFPFNIKYTHFLLKIADSFVRWSG